MPTLDMLYPLAGPGPWQWVILAVVALLLFGGTRLAGLGKSAGRAIREFKEETASLKASKGEDAAAELDGSTEAKTDTKTDA